MTTETEKSPREIAEQIILREYGVTWKGDNELIAAIEKALRDRDERAAKMAETVHAGKTFDVDAILRAEIASAIRGKS